MMLFLAAVFVPLATASAGDVATSRRPNIIFVIADDMRPEMFNFLPEGKGKNLTPTLDRLAEEGVIMEQQYVASPVCTPSRFNCLTGRYASRALNQSFLQTTERFGQTVVNWNTFITPEDESIAHLLQKAGYATGFVGKNHVIDVEGLKKLKWEADPRDPQVVSQLKANADQIEQAIKECGFDYAENIYNNNPDHLGVRELAVHNLDWITKAGLDFIEQNEERPFFLYFATTVPHGPNQHDRSWDADPRKTAEGYLDETLDVMPPRRSLPERLRKAGLAEGNNKANVLWLDDAVAALMAKLKEHDLEENTIVFFFNDHGQTAKGTLYQGGVLNPSAIWRKGGFACGSTCQVRVSNIDFAPTILDLAEVPAHDAAFDGRSFAAALNGSESEIHDWLYFEMGFTRALLMGDYKYLALRYPSSILKLTQAERQKRLDEFNAEMKRRGRPLSSASAETPFSHISAIPGGGDAERESTSKYESYYDADQLYDLASDPQEQVNLTDQPHEADRLEALKRQLDRIVSDLPGTFGEFGSNP